MKKLIVIVLVTIIALAVFAGCTNNERVVRDENGTAIIYGESVLYENILTEDVIEEDIIYVAFVD